MADGLLNFFLAAANEFLEFGGDYGGRIFRRIFGGGWEVYQRQRVACNRVRFLAFQLCEVEDVT